MQSFVVYDIFHNLVVHGFRKYHHPNSFMLINSCTALENQFLLTNLKSLSNFPNVNKHLFVLVQRDFHRLDCYFSIAIFWLISLIIAEVN